MADGQKAFEQTRFVFERLRRNVIEGVAAPGTKVNIAVVAEEHQVNPGALRPASLPHGLA
ncbi:hypothetical protein [Paraburkholderia sp. GAS42]|uniref:hypothetical protein n=1 Tax=Paraburkholderia sp. GAS42 TaxID=3035135 RepID=UPI003D1F3488